MNTYNDPIDVRGRYVCPACPVRFTSLADKKHHVRTEHGPKPAKAER